MWRRGLWFERKGKERKRGKGQGNGWTDGRVEGRETSCVALHCLHGRIA